ncbi:MAG: hypothetical protein RLZZ630_2251, partial [Bacteroidota bacterium]
VPTGFTITSGQGSSTISVSFTGMAVQSGIRGLLCALSTDACSSQVYSCANIDYQVAAPVTPPSISGPTKVCPGDTAIYSIAAVARASSYNWTVPTGVYIISGQGGQVLAVAIGAGFQGGVFSVVASNVCGNSNARTKTVGWNVLTGSMLISGPTSGLCNASGVAYTTTPLTGASGYYWGVPAGSNLVSGQGTTGVVVNYGGSFVSGNLTVTAQNGCGNGSMRSVSVKAAPGQPEPISGPLVLCANQLYGYSVASVGGATAYNWTVPAGFQIQSGQGTKTLALQAGPNAASSLSISVNASNACGNSSARSLTAISVSGCLRLVETGVDLEVYPNPAQDRVVIRNLGSDIPIHLQSISDIAGRMVSYSVPMDTGSNRQLEIDIQQLPPGLYMLNLLIGTEYRYLKLVVE